MNIEIPQPRLYLHSESLNRGDNRKNTINELILEVALDNRLLVSAIGARPLVALMGNCRVSESETLKDLFQQLHT